MEWYKACKEKFERFFSQHFFHKYLGYIIVETLCSYEGRHAQEGKSIILTTYTRNESEKKI